MFNVWCDCILISSDIPWSGSFKSAWLNGPTKFAIKGFIFIGEKGFLVNFIINGSASKKKNEILFQEEMI